MQFLNFSTELRVESGNGFVHDFACFGRDQFSVRYGEMGIALPLAPAAPLADNGTTSSSSSTSRGQRAEGRLWPHQKCRQSIGHYTHTQTHHTCNNVECKNWIFRGLASFWLKRFGLHLRERILDISWKWLEMHSDNTQSRLNLRVPGDMRVHLWIYELICPLIGYRSYWLAILWEEVIFYPFLTS